MRSRTVVAGMCAGLIALAAPVAAQARTKAVTLGPPPSASKAFGKLGANVNDFFPDAVRIHVGDSVRFLPVGFHTVDLPKKGSHALVPLLVPGSPLSGVTDAAGAPFWFNGRPAIGFNTALTASAFGKTMTWDGSARVDSGFPPPPPNPPPPLTVKFTRAGRITYYCDVHPGMKATIDVLPKGRRLPSARQDSRALKAQITRDLKAARKLRAVKTPKNVVDVGSAGADGVEYFGMVPRTLTVAKGTKVTFRMSKPSYETHTVTFGPGPVTSPTSYVGAISASFQSTTPDNRGIFPSDPGPLSVTPAAHGNGFVNTGAMQPFKGSPLPSSTAVTFPVAGTYTYVCVIHPSMMGTIVVR